MAITLGTNIASLKAQRELQRSSLKLSGVYERLSSGLRINKPSDDPAGLALSERLASQSRLYSRAARNINDGISYLSVAESGLASLSDILIRMQELSVQAANGSYSSAQRNALDVEAQALRNEYNRIASSTQFNGTNAFSTSGSGLTLQVGPAARDYFNIDFIQDQAEAQGDGTYTNQTISIVLPTVETIDALQMIVADFNGDGIDDLAFGQLQSSGSGPKQLYFDMGFVLGSASGTYSLQDQIHEEGLDFVTSGSIDLYLQVADLGSDGDLDLRYSTNLIAGHATNDGSGNFTETGNFPDSIFSGGQGAFSVTGDFNGDGVEDQATFYSTGSALLTAIVKTQGAAHPAAFEMGNFSLLTAESALAAQELFAGGVENIASLRGKVGAQLNRLDTAYQMALSMVTEYGAAHSRIRDADIAAEVAEMTRLSILQQAAAAMFAQANQQQRLVLTLLE